MSILTGKRRCSECGEWKNVSEFHKDKNCRDGLKKSCKTCRCAEVRQYQSIHREQNNARVKKWGKENPEKIRAWGRRWRENNPEVYKNYYKENVADYIAKAAKWAMENPEKRRAIRNRWNKKNPELKLALTRNRRAKMKGNGGVITAAEWRNVLDKYGHKCLRCENADVKLTMDHVIPIQLGGTHTVDNVQPLCQPCNSWKGARVIDYRDGCGND